MYLGWMILRFSNHMRIKRECVTLAYINICSKNPRKGRYKYINEKQRCLRFKVTINAKVT